MTDLTNMDLASLAAGIEAEHSAAKEHLKAGLAHAVRAGEMLLRAKGLVGHGAWLPWLAANCTVSERTAQAYMRVASKHSELVARDPQRVADLSFREGLRLLAEPREVAATITEWNPNNRFIPADYALVGVGLKVHIAIEQSAVHKGFYHVTVVQRNEDGSGELHETKRPMRGDALEHLLTHIGPECVAENVEWTQIGGSQ